jgi:hypothetical protein
VNGNLAAAMTRALSCGVWPQEGRVSVYVSYTDESESRDQKRGKFLIGGYVADELKWPEFSKRWSEEIITSSPTIPYLHMVDIRSEAWRAKHGITRLQADEKVKRAIQIISQTDFICGYFAPISEPAYLKALQVFLDVGPKGEKNHSKIDYLCFVAYSLHLIKNLSAEHPDLRKVVFNISRKKIISHHLQTDLYDAMVAYLRTFNPAVAKLFGDVVPLIMENHMPLQAADVLCWHVQRLYAKRESEEPEVKRNTVLLMQKNLYKLQIADSALETLADDIRRIAAQEENIDGKE